MKLKLDALSQNERVISELSQEIQAGTIAKQDNVRLKEQVQDYYEELSQLRKIEVVAERYRRKLEANQDIQTRIRVLQDENQALSQTLENYESAEGAINAREDVENKKKKELDVAVTQLEWLLLAKEQEVVGLQEQARDQQLRIDELTLISRSQNEITAATDEEEGVQEEGRVVLLQGRVNELEKEVEALRKGGFREPHTLKSNDIRSLIDHYEVLMRVNTDTIGGGGGSKRISTYSGESVPAQVSMSTTSTSVSAPTKVTNWKEEVFLAKEEARLLKKELVVMSRAWHSLAARMQQQNMMVMKRAAETPAGWLSRQRRALDRLSPSVKAM